MDASKAIRLLGGGYDIESFKWAAFDLFNVLNTFPLFSWKISSIGNLNNLKCWYP